MKRDDSGEANQTEGKVEVQCGQQVISRIRQINMNILGDLEISDLINRSTLTITRQGARSRYDVFICLCMCACVSTLCVNL